MWFSLMTHRAISLFAFQQPFSVVPTNPFSHVSVLPVKLTNTVSLLLHPSLPSTFHFIIRSQRVWSPTNTCYCGLMMIKKPTVYTCECLRSQGFPATLQCPARCVHKPESGLFLQGSHNHWRPGERSLPMADTIHGNGMRGAWDTQQVESARGDQCLTINAE